MVKVIVLYNDTRLAELPFKLIDEAEQVYMTNGDETLTVVKHPNIKPYAVIPASEFGDAVCYRDREK